MGVAALARYRALPLILLILAATSCSLFPGAGNGPSAAGLLSGSGQQLRLQGSLDDPPTLDPALARDNESAFIIRQIFSGLVTFDANLQVQPDLAESLPSVSADGKTFTFKLRQGVHFQDGRELTAEDVQYSFERAADPSLAAPDPPSSLPAATYLGDIVGVRDKLEGRARTISGIKVLGPREIAISIDQPKAYFLSKLAHTTAMVVDRHNLEGRGPRWFMQPNGTGPFRLTEWQAGEWLVLQRFDQYFAGPPKLAQVRIFLGVNATQPMVQYEQNRLDVIDVPFSDVERALDPSSPLHRDLVTVPELTVTYLGFNTRQPPFDDVRVRQAIARAIDKQKIVKVMLQDKVTLARGIVPPNLPGYAPSSPDLTFDLTASRELLEQSTYRGPQNLPRLPIASSDGTMAAALGEVLHRNLGIEVEARQVEWKDYLDGLNRGDFGAYVLSWVADYPDPENFLGVLFGRDSSENHTGYAKPEVENLLAAAGVERDPGKRGQLYARAEQIIIGDAAVVPLYHGVSYVLKKDYVRGLVVTPMGILSLKDAEIAR